MSKLILKVVRKPLTYMKPWQSNTRLTVKQYCSTNFHERGGGGGLLYKWVCGLEENISEPLCSESEYSIFLAVSLNRSLKLDLLG